jgi:hypothetical protein
MTIPLIRQAITELGTVLTEQENKASDLWSWLPSYRAASRAHGDRASDFRPSVIGVMIEAAAYISHGLQPTQEQLKDPSGPYGCPCGKCSESN